MKLDCMNDVQCGRCGFLSLNLRRLLFSKCRHYALGFRRFPHNITFSPHNGYICTSARNHIQVHRYHESKTNYNRCNSDTGLKNYCVCGVSIDHTGAALVIESVPCGRLMECVHSVTEVGIQSPCPLLMSSYSCSHCPRGLTGIRTRVMVCGGAYATLCMCVCVFRK